VGALAAGFACDRLFNDPSRWHPVAGFGQAAGRLERQLWRPSRLAGLAYAAALVAFPAAAASLAESLLASRRLLLSGYRTATIWVTLGGRSLELAAFRLVYALDEGDIAQARALAPALVGRDPRDLDRTELSRAAIESVAENTSDAVVAPLLWASLLGTPGAVAYRAVNTLDAMVGHKDERHLRFGWAAARLDDLANWPAARLTALLAVAAAPLLGGDVRAAWRGAFRDGRAHPSPNAGRAEGAFAGALGIRLGGLNRYRHGPELRPALGQGRPPTAADIERAVRLARLVDGAALAVCAALAGRRR